MKRKIIALAVAMFTLSGCGIYSKYNPATTVPENLFGAIEADTTHNLAHTHWRRLFTDPHLQAIIEQGLQNNTDLQAAHWRVEEARASLSAARLAYLPSLALAPQGTLSSIDKGRAVQTYSLPLTATWEVDVFGRITNAKRRAKALYAQSREYELAVKTALIANLANAYYTLLMLDAQLGISEETEVKWKESVRVMQALKNAGQGNEAGLAQTEANYYSICTTVLDLKEQISEVENSLCLMLGQVPHTVDRSRTQEKLPLQELPVGLPLQLLANRPDVKMAEWGVAQAFYSTNEARAAFYPSITLSGSGGWTNGLGEVILNPGKLLLSAVGSLTQPLFSGKQNIARLKIAKARQEEAKQTFTQTLLNAGAEVNNALKQTSTARNKSYFYQRQIASLQRAVASTQLLMQHGSSTYLEVLTAQQALLAARLTQAGNRLQEVQGVINLYQALGGGGAGHN